MTIELAEEPMAALPEYARVPIIFTVDGVLVVTNRDDGRSKFALSERRLEVPYERPCLRHFSDAFVNNPSPGGPFAHGPRRGPAGAGPRVGSQALRYLAAPPACHRRADHPVPRLPPAAAARTTCDRLPSPELSEHETCRTKRRTARSAPHVAVVRSRLAGASRIEQPEIGRSCHALGPPVPQ